MMRQPVGMGVELGVAQPPLLEQHRDRIRRARRLRRKQLRQRRGRDRPRRVVPALQDRRALAMHPAAAATRPQHRPAPPPPPAPAPDAPPTLHRAAIEQVRPVVEPQAPAVSPAARSAPADNAWRRGPRPHRAEARWPPPQAPIAVDRIVLEHQQRVEQLAQPAGLLDLGQADDAGAPSAPTAAPGSAAAARHGCPGSSRSRSGSVLMNSPTIRSTPASSAGRPATVTPNTTSSRPVSRPSSTPEAACSNVFSVTAALARQRRQRRAQPGVKRQPHLLRRNRRAAAAAAAQAACPPPDPTAPAARPQARPPDPAAPSNAR